MPYSPNDLAGLRVAAENFLAAVLETVAQPIWVVDPDGLIQFANPAAIAALGYDSADELLGRHSHETIHYKHLDGSPYPAADCSMLLPRTTGERVSSELDWFVRRDGSMLAVSYLSVPIAMLEGRGAVVAFTNLDDRIRAERALGEHEAVLAAQQASLRRVATLVAGGAASAEVFSAIASEVAQVLGMALVVIWRFEPSRPDLPATVVGAWGDRPHPFQPGTTWHAEEHTVAELLPELGRPRRIEDFSAIGGMIPDAIAETGVGSGAGAAIVVNGEFWGTMGAGVAGGEPLPEHIEDRLAEFTELVATAIANTASRDQLARLADEQAALRRVATLVARGTPPEEVFAAVVNEVARVLEVDYANLGRFESDGTVTLVASARDRMPVGSRWPLGETSLAPIVLRTGRPARIDDYGQAEGQFAGATRNEGIRCGVAMPIAVEGRLWGLMAVANSHEQSLPPHTEVRLASFTELVATAIADTEARTEVAASRARIVAATDEERRRVVRDLHDGAQQRLVHTIITLKLAQHAFKSEEQDAPTLLAQALDHAEQATAELRELAHGILPAVLIQGGLRAGVDALASRMPVPVECGVSVDRLSAPIEATAYFVVAEALTNVAKHAEAERATVVAHLGDGRLYVEVRDDGVGGARPDGSGLVGLTDRLAVLAGRLRVESPAGGGTLIAATIPVPHED